MKLRAHLPDSTHRPGAVEFYFDNSSVPAIRIEAQADGSLALRVVEGTMVIEPSHANLVYVRRGLNSQP